MAVFLKIIIAGIAGTSVMTLFSYYMSKREKEQYREPELLNGLIRRSKMLPSLNNVSRHPAGWLGHYLIGVAFVAGYYFIWPDALYRPDVFKILTLGIISGILGIIGWKIFFSSHDNPPRTYKHGYYRQLFIAHLIFTAVAILTYKLLESI